MIINSSFYHLNEDDHLQLTVDKKSATVVKEFKKDMPDGYIFLKILADGLACFGFTMLQDPQHGNQEYTWSSNAYAVNTELNLWGTEYEVIECSLRELHGDYPNTWFAYACLTSVADACAQVNASALKRGVLRYLSRIHNTSYNELDQLKDGDIITKERIATEWGFNAYHHNKILRGEETFWMPYLKVSEQYYRKHGHTPTWWKVDQIVYLYTQLPGQVTSPGCTMARCQKVIPTSIGKRTHNYVI